jgi:hypothetical protein
VELGVAKYASIHRARTCNIEFQAPACLTFAVAPLVARNPQWGLSHITPILDLNYVLPAMCGTVITWPSWIGVYTIQICDLNARRTIEISYNLSDFL